MAAEPSSHRTSIRVATFNVENLMARFDFNGRKRDEDRVLRLFDLGEDEAEDAERARLIALTDDTRQHSALAVADTEADIVCLQEVENLDTLDAFESGYLHRMLGQGYKQKVWREGNDKRGIDVAVMARETTATGDPIEIIQVTSHKRLSYGEAELFEEVLPRRIQHPNERVFRRDLLQVDCRVGSRRLTLYVSHLKAMGGAREDDDGEWIDGRQWSMPIRLAEARAMRAIIERNHTPVHNWMICADLNDYSERIVIDGPRGAPTFAPTADPSEAIDALLADGFAVNPVSRLPADERWTLFHADRHGTRHLCQLDYVLLSPSLARANPDAMPAIVRGGQPHRTPFPPGQDGARYPRVGWDRPKASDHCPVAITVELP